MQSGLFWDKILNNKKKKTKQKKNNHKAVHIISSLLYIKLMTECAYQVSPGKT